MGSHDSKELEKFTKFFIFKSIQTIVQSRIGRRSQTKSKEKRSDSNDVVFCIVNILAFQNTGTDRNVILILSKGYQFHQSKCQHFRDPDNFHFFPRPRSSGAEWFNLAIEDDQNVQDEIRKALEATDTMMPPQHPICVETVLRVRLSLHV